MLRKVTHCAGRVSANTMYIVHPLWFILLVIATVLLILCSFDHSWRLWDLETQTEVLHQVRASFPDSGDNKSVSKHVCIRIRLFVVDSFVCVILLTVLFVQIPQEGHSREVYNVCFHPDGSLAGSW